jgi:hypothetical protein
MRINIAALRFALSAALYLGTFNVLVAFELSSHTTDASRRLLRSKSVYHETHFRRRVEDGGAANSFQQGAGDTFADMFVTSPSNWTPLEWGVFFLLLLIFGICFFCFCVCFIVPQCCGHRAAMAYAAMS